MSYRGKHRSKRGGRKIILIILVIIPLILITSVITSRALQRQRNKPQPIAKKTDGIQRSKDETATKEKEAQPAAFESATATISLAAVGDIMFDRRVWRAIERYGSDWPFANATPLLAAADIAFANLENPLSARGAKQVGKDVTFRGNPAALTGIKNAGIDIVSLANNHVFDYGVEAYKDTADALSAAGIRYAGAGLNIEQAYEPVIYETTGTVKIGFVAYSEIIPRQFIPSNSKYGVASVKLDAGRARTKIAELRPQVDILIASIHWGQEYSYTVTKKQKEAAYFLIDAGADIVLGQHPHVIQGIEIYKGKLIAYSLGNFVFDHFKKMTGESIILKGTFNKEGAQSLEIIPVLISSDGQPSPVVGRDAKAINDRLIGLSPLLTSPAVVNDRLVWKKN